MLFVYVCVRENSEIPARLRGVWSDDTPPRSDNVCQKNKDSKKKNLLPACLDFAWTCILSACSGRSGVPRERGPAAEAEGGGRGAARGDQRRRSERHQEEADQQTGGESCDQRRPTYQRDNVLRLVGW